MARGDESAYRAFHAAYFHRLFRYLLVVASGHEDSACEALPGTLRRVVAHVRVFTDETVFWSWLTRLARSAYQDERRKRWRYLAFLDRFTRHAEIEQAISVPSDADARLGELLQRRLALLPAAERELVEWKYTDRLSVRVIAERLGATEKTVESRLTRVRTKLKNLVLAALQNEDAP